MIKEKIISFKGSHIDEFYIPPFDLHRGELIGIMVGNQIDGIGLENKIIDFFSRKENYINPKYILQYANHFEGKKWFGLERYVIKTVGSYLKIHANNKSGLSKLVYDVDYITPSTCLDVLSGNHRRLLTLTAKSSKTKCIIFDTCAQDPKGVQDTLEFLKQYVVGKGGAAIWIDYFGKHKEMCTKYISVLKNGNEIKYQSVHFKVKK